MTTPAADVTGLLRAIDHGDSDAAERLFPIVYQELRGMARAKMAQERPGNTLSPTALVHEAYLRLVGGEGAKWRDRSYFFAAAAEAMRRILIDRARRRQALKRGGPSIPEELEETAAVAAAEPDPDEILALNVALERLEELEPELAQVVKLRYFAGLTVEETAAALQESVRTVARRWAAARAFLSAALSGRIDADAAEKADDGI